MEETFEYPPTGAAGHETYEAAVNMGGEGGAPYPSMDTPEYEAAAETNFGDPAINPAGAAGSPEGAGEMFMGEGYIDPAMGFSGVAPDGNLVMDAAFEAPTDPSAPMDINPADAALGAAMDSAMDQGSAPAGNGPGITQEALDDPRYVDPAMDDDQGSDDDGGIAG